MRLRRDLAWVGLILVVAACRVMPHAPNFTPVGALALWSGVHWPHRRGAWLAPLIALLLGDLARGWWFGEALFEPITAVVYLSFLAPVGIGFLLRERHSSGRWPTMSAAVLGTSLSFFILSNAGVWLIAGWYPLTWSGLTACYVAALPFLAPTVCGDVLFSGLLWAGWRLAIARRSAGLRELAPEYELAV